MENATKESRIAEFFEDKSVFITGATGFIGKMIVLKLLRNCPRTSRVYVLIREKGGKTAAERLEDVLETEPFQHLLMERPDARERVTAIAGDIVAENLALKPSDLEHFCNQVFVVIHAAASVRFDEPITRAMETNIGGLMNILEVARKITNLQSFVYISTAYSNCNRAKIEEVIYPTSITPQHAIERLASLNEDDVFAFTQTLLEGRPNSYTFTKALAEHLINTHRNELPVCIVRPSIVSPAETDPVPGWVDSWNGATGVVGFTVHGLLRFMLVGPQFTNLDVIPVDHVVNLVVAAAWFTATARNAGMDPYFIYNCCSGGSNSLSAQRFAEMAVFTAWEIPFSQALWYPHLRLVKNRWVYKSCDLLFHRLPCELMDLVAKIFSRKQRMMKSYRKMCRMINALSFFLTVDFDFSIENTKKLYEHMSPVDKQAFPFDVDVIDWGQYVRHMVLGIRKYLLRESDAQLEEDRARNKRLYVVHCVLRGFVAFLFAFLLVLLLFF